MPPILRYHLDPEIKEREIGLVLPRGGDAGFDLCASKSISVDAGEQVLVPTGLRVAIPSGWVGLVKDRSSMASKKIYTHAGVIDSAYRGEVRIVLSNSGSEAFQIEAGDRIAQMIVVPCLTDSLEVESVSELGDTERGSGGFGSTGK